MPDLADTATRIQAISEPLIALLGALLAAIAPVTAYILSRAKLKLAERAQKHKLDLAKVAQQHKLDLAKAAQQHQIATAYLDRALNPEVPLAMRQQLLRFLSTKVEGDKQLQTWATAELLRVDAVVEGLDREVEEAERKVHAAKTPGELRLAESRMVAAVARKQSAVEVRKKPPVSGASIRAGFYSYNKTDLIGVVLDGENLEGAPLDYSTLRGASFRNATLSGATLQGADLRTTTFADASCQEVSFYLADLRGADLSNADLSRADLTQAHLQGANLTGANLENAIVKAVFDRKTIWPSGFDPEAAGSMLSEDEDEDEDEESAV